MAHSMALSHNIHVETEENDKTPESGTSHLAKTSAGCLTTTKAGVLLCSDAQ
jgi:hypothetical protein